MMHVWFLARASEKIFITSDLKLLMRHTNFRWKEAVWLALDDCGDDLSTQGVYFYVGKYRQLTDYLLEIDDQGVMERYKNTVRNILNGFRKRGIIEGAKENAELKYGTYNWIGIYTNKEIRKQIREKVENGLPLEYALRNCKTFL